MVYSRTNQLTLEKRLCSQSVTNVPLDRLRNSCFAEMVKVIITGHKGGEETKVYPIASMETCWELKKRIAEDMEVPMDNVALFYKEKPCADGNSVNTYVQNDKVPILNAKVTKPPEPEKTTAPRVN